MPKKSSIKNKILNKLSQKLGRIPKIINIQVSKQYKRR